MNFKKVFRFSYAFYFFSYGLFLVKTWQAHGMNYGVNGATYILFFLIAPFGVFLSTYCFLKVFGCRFYKRIAIVMFSLVCFVGAAASILASIILWVN